MEANDFGRYLKNLRKEKKLTIRQLELYSKVSNAYISQMERGDRGVPSPDILKKLAKPLGVEYEELMQNAGHLSNGEQIIDHRDPVDKLIDYLDLELTDDEIIERMNFKVDNLTLSNDEIREFIAFVRAKRFMKQGPQASVSKLEGL